MNKPGGSAVSGGADSVFGTDRGTPSCISQKMGRNSDTSIISLHRQRGSTLILVTHDLNLAESFCSRVVFLKEGRIEADITKGPDSSDPMITPDLIQKVFGVESQIITDGTHSRVILSYGD